MEKNSQKHVWPEVVFGSADSKNSQAIRRAVAAGELKKIASRLYTSNLKDAPEKIVTRNLFHILGHFFPEAILSHRSALEGGAPKEGMLVLTYKYTKNFTLPGVTVRLIKGKEAITGDTPFIANLYLASRERAFLENLQPSRDRGNNTKTLPIEFIEHHLERWGQSYGAEELNKILDKAKLIAKELSLEKEFKILNKIIGALL